MRQIVLDTETTGLEYREGHRIIEIGCVELVNRRLTGNNFHLYLQPDREIDEGAVEVHGIDNAFLADKPRFADVVDDFVDYIKGAELVIHNAAFDVGFIDNELRLVGEQWGGVKDHCVSVLDTLSMARKLHPGQKNSLDALCRRYQINNAHRVLHGALLDAEILADVYLAMTGGQTTLSLDPASAAGVTQGSTGFRRIPADRPPLTVVRATREEMTAHEAAITAVEKAIGKPCRWRSLDGED